MKDQPMLTYNMRQNNEINRIPNKKLHRTNDIYSYRKIIVVHEQDFTSLEKLFPMQKLNWQSNEVLRKLTTFCFS